MEQENLPTPPLPNSASWLFNPSIQTNTTLGSSRICVLQIDSEDVKDENLSSDMDDDIYEWNYDNNYDYL